MFLFTWQTLFKLSDAGLNILLRFFSLFLTLLEKVFSMNLITGLISKLPYNVRSAKVFLSCKGDSFQKYSSCPKCNPIYDLEDCKQTLPDKSVISAECKYVAFPDHPHSSRRVPCNTVLMKKVKTPSGTTALYPRQMYCYKSVKESLQELILRPGFIDCCEHWRNRKQTQGLLQDIYDGKLWKEFQNIDGSPFLCLPFNYLLTLNIDWFQPFKHTQYSTGAIYLSVQNLPRKLRFKQENIILVGIIPGPKEPSLNVNTYLWPMVEELKQLWDGTVMKTPAQDSVVVRCALTCVACDIPAARKVCGYVGHNALRGCSRCLKTFPTNCFGERFLWL